MKQLRTAWRHRDVPEVRQWFRLWLANAAWTVLWSIPLVPVRLVAASLSVVGDAILRWTDDLGPIDAVHQRLERRRDKAVVAANQRLKAMGRIDAGRAALAEAP